MATLEQSELDIALERLTPQWLAGLFDGEGCVSIVRHRNNVPSLCVNISQSEYNILALIGIKFGDGKEPYKKYSSFKKKQGWCIAFNGKNALPFLLHIQPHVVLKRKLVDWAVEMSKLHGQAGGNRRSKGGWMDPEIRSRREELMLLVREENQKGKIQ